MSHPDFWLPWASGRDTLNLFNIESSTTGWPGHVADHLTEQPPEAAADELARLGVTHVAVINDQAAQPFLASSRFATVWRSPPLALLAVAPRQGQPAPGSLLSTPVAAQARLVRAEAQHLVIEATTGEPTSATIAVAWSPKWHAGVNGRAAALGRSANGLLMLSLPAGTSSIELVFAPDVGCAGCHPYRTRVCGAGWLGMAQAPWRPGPLPGQGRPQAGPLALGAQLLSCWWRWQREMAADARDGRCRLRWSRASCGPAMAVRVSSALRRCAGPPALPQELRRRRCVS